jgi:hypothetical protein
VSFRRLLERTITIVPRLVTGQDARNNDLVTDGTPIGPLPAARDQLEASESVDTEDAQTRVFVYMLPCVFGGQSLVISGHDRIIDNGEPFEVRGTPEVIRRRRGGRPHHIEAIAYRQD